MLTIAKRKGKDDHGLHEGDNYHLYTEVIFTKLQTNGTICFGFRMRYAEFAKKNNIL